MTFLVRDRRLTSFPTGKRKQALLESNLPGISCSTGMVKGEAEKIGLSLFLEFIPRAGCLEKLIDSSVLFRFIVLQFKLSRR